MEIGSQRKPLRSPDTKLCAKHYENGIKLDDALAKTPPYSDSVGTASKNWADSAQELGVADDIDALARLLIPPEDPISKTIDDLTKAGCTTSLVAENPNVFGKLDQSLFG